jgi:hypothetical protein
MIILKKIFERLGIGIIEPNKTTFWYNFKNHILLEKGSTLIASCFVFLFISGPLVLLLGIFDFIILPNAEEGKAQGFGLAIILSIIMGIINFISSEYRGYYIIKEFVNRVIPLKPIKSSEDYVNDIIGHMDVEYLLRQIEKKIKISDAITLLKKINETEEIKIIN